MEQVVKSRFKIYSGKTLSLKKYLKIWDLDNHTFGVQDLLPKDKGIKWFEYSQRSIISLWDIKESKLIGYIYPFLFERSFAEKYITTKACFQNDIVKESFACPVKNSNLSIYIFSTVIIKDYRDKLLIDDDIDSKFHNKPTFKVLNEALVEWICNILKKEVNLDYVISEIVSKDGLKYVKSLGLIPCTDEKGECKFANQFNPLMFKRCDNIEKLIKEYNKSKLKQKARTNE